MSSVTSIDSSDPHLWAPWTTTTIYEACGWPYSKWHRFDWGDWNWRHWKWNWNWWREESNAIELVEDGQVHNLAVTEERQRRMNEIVANANFPEELRESDSHELRSIYLWLNPLGAFQKLPFLPLNCRTFNHWAIEVASDQNGEDGQKSYFWDMVPKTGRQIYMRIGTMSAKERAATRKNVGELKYNLGRTDWTDLEISQQALIVIRDMAGERNNQRLSYSLAMRDCQGFALELASHICEEPKTIVKQWTRKYWMIRAPVVLVAFLLIMSGFAIAAIVLAHSNYSTPVQDAILATVGLFCGITVFLFVNRFVLALF